MILSKLLLMGLLVFPPVTPNPIPVPKPKTVVFQVGESQYDIEEKKREAEQEAEQAKYEVNWSEGIATGYYDGKDKMNGETGITASGYNLDRGITFRGYNILASDKAFPLGTLIDVKLPDGTVLNCVVLDRGGAIRGNHFDIVFNTLEECLSFGKQKIEWQVVGKMGI
jgi:3D (Asp-Asp-Asp) domain-containing protein